MNIAEIPDILSFASSDLLTQSILLARPNEYRFLDIRNDNIIVGKSCQSLYTQEPLKTISFKTFLLSEPNSIPTARRERSRRTRSYSSR